MQLSWTGTKSQHTKKYAHGELWTVLWALLSCINVAFKTFRLIESFLKREICYVCRHSWLKMFFTMSFPASGWPNLSELSCFEEHWGPSAGSLSHWQVSEGKHKRETPTTSTLSSMFSTLYVFREKYNTEPRGQKHILSTKAELVLVNRLCNRKE